MWASMRILSVGQHRGRAEVRSSMSERKMSRYLQSLRFVLLIDPEWPPSCATRGT